MKRTDGKSEVEWSDVILFVVLIMFLIVLFVGLAAAIGTWAINSLLVLFAVNMVPFSVWEGFQILLFLWIIGLFTRGWPNTPRRGN